MGRKKKHCNKAVARAIPPADWLPPESSPSRYYSQLVFTDVEGGCGPLCIVGRELQLVWYDSEKDRDREKNGKLIAVLEFQDCWSCLEPGGERYHFAGLLMEEVSGEYRRWLGNQQHQGRSFAEDTDVLETRVRFSVMGRNTLEGSPGAFEPAGQPFFLEDPSVETLSSPQLDMLFDVMSFLYQSIPAMKLMADLRAQQDAKLAK
ncbi:MAG: hypothetical protein ACQESR_18545 [Planctomycetota bacterium]